MDEALAHYVAVWRLSDVRPLCGTNTSDLFTASCDQGPTVLKIFTEAGIADEVAGASVLQWYYISSFATWKNVDVR
jgi:streptomycin 6-kinase